MKAFLFDMDGTLIDSVPDIRANLNKMAACFGYEPYTIRQVINAIGSGVRELVRAIINQPLTEEELDQRVAYFNENYEKTSMVFTKPFDGIVELLLELKKRGHKIAILSNKLKSECESIADELFGKGVFDVIYGNGEGVPIKPDKRCVEAVVQALGVKKTDAVMVGDMLTDLRVAQNAGVDYAIVEWGYGDKNELIKNGARNFVQKPLDILKNFL